MSVIWSQSLAAQSAIDAPGWAPIVFAAGAFAVMALVLVLMWRKLRQTDSWYRRPNGGDPTDPDADYPGHDDDPGSQR